jgi:uncharacterized protein (DUF2267 family)
MLRPSASAFDAARAIENNNIGAVVVGDKAGVRGIVTDRDLAIRLVGRGLDAQTTALSEIMTAPVATLPASAGHDEAIRLMRERNIRRIPLVGDGGRFVGIVTLDDLLLDEAAPLEQLAAVIEVQLGEGGPTPTRQRGRGGGTARAESTYRRFLKHAANNAGLGAAQVETAVEVVLGALVRRLTPGEAKDLIAQLPSVLHPQLSSLPAGPDKSITKETIVSELVQRLDMDPDRAASVVGAVGLTIAESVSAGQVEDVQGQLPEVLRFTFWPTSVSP